jgi:hypothetical protein
MEDPADWYEDPDDSAKIRYWDGSEWTKLVKSIDLEINGHLIRPPREAAWPPRTDWEAKAQKARTKYFRKGMTSFAAERRAAAERETQRVPDDWVQPKSEYEAELEEIKGRSWWGRYFGPRRDWDDPRPPDLPQCGVCEMRNAIIDVPHWRDDYNTYRCRFCLSWSQTKIPKAHISSGPM